MYFLQELSSSGIGSLGRFSSCANVMPGFDFGFMEFASGDCAAAGKACVLAFADSADRVSPLVSAVDILANVSSRDVGCVKVRTAITIDVSYA